MKDLIVWQLATIGFALVLSVQGIIYNYIENPTIEKLQSDIKESRHREDLLLQEDKQLQYQCDVLTEKLR